MRKNYILDDVQLLADYIDALPDQALVLVSSWNNMFPVTDGTQELIDALAPLGFVQKGSKKRSNTNQSEY